MINLNYQKLINVKLSIVELHDNVLQRFKFTFSYLTLLDLCLDSD